MTPALTRIWAIALSFSALQRVPLCSQGADNRTALAVYDQVLDTRVRDGYVYYRALQADRRGLDRYVASLADADVTGTPHAEMAFWLNAYNALVLQTVIDHYPSRSLQQVPGAFQKVHRVAGKTLSLDQIEQTRLASFHDPRVFFALGRGAVSSGRLRSEAYAADSLERQLGEQADECGTRDRCIRVDPASNRLLASQIFQWRRKDFADAYATSAGRRPPLERAVIAFAGPRHLDAEREVLARDRFKIEYLPFDWSLNDLAQRRR